MLIHLVLLKPRPELTDLERRTFTEAFEHAVRSIPSVRGVRVGRRVTHGADYEQTAPDMADYVGLIEFDDLSGLEQYLAHPAHRTLGNLFHSSLTGAMVYDFEVGGLEVLSNLITSHPEPSTPSQQARADHAHRAGWTTSRDTHKPTKPR